ncbi:hypothetical protein EC973_000300 [Apophysomyces ossiformis]|uniref:Uncharacterized protein n=1 Tax=Apophysomyces ossiformis TaxID=679940 RepID=A0A8H7EPC8_9FUNG|nr:hypothetical protein EC973_000300 [Apophysomyces ossiformis]
MVLFSAVTLGAILLLLLVVINRTVQTSVTEEEEDFMPLLMKSGLQPLNSGSAHVPYGLYKPYSVFGEELSHISEEDMSAIQQMASSTSLIRHASWAASNDSSSRSSRTATAAQQQALSSVSVSSFELALLPLSPPESPMVVIVSYLPWIDLPDEYQQPQHLMEDKHSKSLLATMFLMGVIGAMINTFFYVFLHYILAMPLIEIGLAAAMTTLMELVAHATKRWGRLT